MEVAVTDCELSSDLTLLAKVGNLRPHRLTGCSFANKLAAPNCNSFSRSSDLRAVEFESRMRVGGKSRPDSQD